MRNGPCNKWVTLSRRIGAASEDLWEPLNPDGIWCAIEPLPPGSSGESRANTHQVRMRFHPEVTVDARLVYVDGRTQTTRTLYALGPPQTVNEQGDEMRLLCEEVSQ
jgi:head-tail adaptor